jgi:hypothetical protein
MPRHTTTGPIVATVDAGVGHVDVVASDREDVLAEATPTRPERSGDVSAASRTTIAFDAGRLTVRVPRRLAIFGQSDSVDVRIELPTGSDLEVESAYGSIRATGSLGDATVTAKYGNVRIDDVGDLTLNAPYGAVDVTTVRGDLDATAGHGQMRIRHVVGDARLRGAHGVIDLGEVDGSVDATTSGALTIERTTSEVSLRGAHGAIRIREAAAGTVRAENGYADVEVGVPEGVAVWLDAASEHGAVRNELAADPTAASSDRTVALHLRANWADVVVRRAATTTGAGA